MPSAIAHVVVGLSLSAWFPGRRRVMWIPALLVALAILPDLDVLGFRFGIDYGHPLGHRGFSHSLLFAVLLGGLSYPVWRRVSPSQCGSLALFCTLALASHGILDAFTDAGLGIGFLIPFDDTRYFAPWRPILTSPLSIRAFVSGHGLSILANEAIWIGIPSFLFGLLAVATRRWRAKS